MTAKISSCYKPNPTGYLILPFDYGEMTIICGPFDAYVGGFGVCLEEKSAKRDHARIDFPIDDFSAPPAEDLEQLVADILVQHEHEPSTPIFIGCRGGFGRTGTVVAALVKVCFHSSGYEAVKYTRREFNSQAVETRGQEKVIEDLDLSRVEAKRAVSSLRTVLLDQAASDPQPDSIHYGFDYFKIGVDFFLAPWRALVTLLR